MFKQTKCYKCDMENKGQSSQSGIFMHMRAYSAIFRDIQNQNHVKNPSIFRTLVYSSHWNIWNPGMFRTNGGFHENNAKSIFQIVKITTVARLVAKRSNQCSIVVNTTPLCICTYTFEQEISVCVCCTTTKKTKKHKVHLTNFCILLILNHVSEW